MYSYLSLTNSPNQTFKVTVPGDTRRLNFILRQSYNAKAGYWTLGIYDTFSNAVVSTIPLIVGVNLLGQYQYLDIGSIYLINTGDASLAPDVDNISNFVLSWKLV